MDSIQPTPEQKRINDLLDANNRFEQAARDARAAQRGGYQDRVSTWLLACFGMEIAADRTERNHRFIEEALELVQACGTTASEAHQLVDYVFNRPIGDRYQEVGGVMNTLAALCLAHNFDMLGAGETELTRCWANLEKIRAKQAAKPKHSPLPEHATLSQDSVVEARPLDEWHEDFGSVVWWTLDQTGRWLGEPAYIGTPLDLGRTILVTVDGQEMTCTVGGWPDYHTHWTPHPDYPRLPTQPIEGQAGV